MKGSAKERDRPAGAKRGRSARLSLQPVGTHRSGVQSCQLSVTFPPALYEKLRAYAAKRWEGRLGPAVRELVMAALSARADAALTEQS